jgi:hypothetical protein
MGQAIAVRTDFTASEVRRFAKRAKDAAQARRLLAIAAVLDGASREAAAKIGGMDRQTLRRFMPQPWSFCERMAKRHALCVEAHISAKVHNDAKGDTGPV